jgi:truncated hemoglobin YjbI
MMTAAPVITPYASIGGEAALLSLVDRFYFYKALQEMPMDNRLRGDIETALQQLATHMINQ